MELDSAILDKAVRDGDTKDVKEIIPLKSCHVVMKNMDHILEGRHSISKSEEPLLWPSSDSSDEDTDEFKGFSNSPDSSDIDIKQEQWQSDNDDNMFEIMNAFSLKKKFENTVKTEPVAAPIKTFAPTSFLSAPLPTDSNVLNFVPTLYDLEGFDFGNEGYEDKKVEPIFPKVTGVTSAAVAGEAIHPFVKIFKPSLKTFGECPEICKQFEEENKDNLKLPISAEDGQSVFSSSTLDALLDSEDTEVSIKHEPPTLLEGLALQDGTPQLIEKPKVRTFESSLHKPGSLNSIKNKLPSMSKESGTKRFLSFNIDENEEFDNALVLQPTANLWRVRKSLQSHKKTMSQPKGSSTSKQLKPKAVSPIHRNEKQRLFTSTKSNEGNFIQGITVDMAKISVKAFQPYDKYFGGQSCVDSGGKADMFSSVKLRSLKRRSTRFNYRELTRVNLPRASMVRVNYHSPKQRKVELQFVQKVTPKMASDAVLPVQVEDKGVLVDTPQPILLKLKKTVVGNSVVHYEHVNSGQVDVPTKIRAFAAIDSESSSGEEFIGFQADEADDCETNPANTIAKGDLNGNKEMPRFQVPAEIQAMSKSLKSFHAMSSNAVRSHFYLERSIKYKKRKLDLSNYKHLCSSLPIAIKSNKENKNVLDISIEKCKLRWTEQQIGQTTVIYPHTYNIPCNSKLICKTEIETMVANGSCARIRELHLVNGKFTHVSINAENGPSILQYSFDGTRFFAPLNDAKLHSIGQVCAKSGFILVLLQSMKKFEKHHTLVKVISTCDWETSKEKIINALIQCDSDIRKAQRGKFICSSVDKFYIEMIRSRSMFDMNASFPWLEKYKLPHVQENPTFARISIKEDINVGPEGTDKVQSKPPLMESMKEIFKIDSGGIFDKKYIFNGLFLLKGQEVSKVNNLVPWDGEETGKKTQNQPQTSKKIKKRPKKQKFELGTIGCLQRTGISESPQKGKIDRESMEGGSVFPPKHLRSYESGPSFKEFLKKNYRRNRKTKQTGRLYANQIKALKDKLLNQIYVKGGLNDEVVGRKSKLINEIINEEKLQSSMELENQVVPVFQLHKDKVKPAVEKNEDASSINPHDRPCMTMINNKQFIAVPVQKKPGCGKGLNAPCFMLMGPVGKNGVEGIATANSIQITVEQDELDITEGADDTKKVTPVSSNKVTPVSCLIRTTVNPPFLQSTVSSVTSSAASTATTFTINKNGLFSTRSVNKQVPISKDAVSQSLPLNVVSSKVTVARAGGFNSSVSNATPTNKLVVVKKTDAQSTTFTQQPVTGKHSMLVRPTCLRPCVLSQPIPALIKCTKNISFFKSVSVNRENNKQTLLREKLRVIRSKGESSQPKAPNHDLLIQDRGKATRSHTFGDHYFRQIPKSKMPLSKYKVFKLLREPKLLINRPAQDVLLTQTAKSKVLYSAIDSFDHSASIKSKPTFTREEKIAKRFTAISTDEVPTCSTDSFESALTRSHSLEDTCTKGDADVDLKSSKTCEKDDMLLNYLNSKASESFNEKSHNNESNKNNNRVVDFFKKIQDLESEKTDTDVLQNTISNEEVLNENEAMPQVYNCTSPSMLEDNTNFSNQEKTEKQLLSDDEIQCDLSLSTNAESIVDKKRTTSPIATTEEVQDSEVWSHDGELNFRDELTEIKEDLSVCVNSCNSVEEINKGEISSSNVISLLDEPEQSKNSQTDTSEDVVMDEASTEDLLSQIESTLSEGDLQIVEEEIVDVESTFEIGDFHFQLDNVEELKLDNFDVNDPMIVDYPVGKKKKKKNTKKSSTKFPLNRNEPPKEEFAVREFHNTIEKLRRWKLRQSFHNLNLSLPKPMTNYSKISVIKEAMKMCIYYTFACKKQELCKQLLLKRNQYLKLKNFYLSRSMRSSYCSVSTSKVDAQIIQLLDEKLADSLPNINHLIKLLALPLYVVVENVKSQKQTQILGELLQKDEMKINLEESADGISPNFSTEIDDSIYISDSETNNIIKKACESLGVIPGLDRMDDVSLLDASTSGINRRKNPQQPVTCSLIDPEKPLQEIDRVLNVHENPSDTIVSDLQEFLKAQIDKRDKPRNSELEKVLTETGSDLQKESPRKKSKRKQDLCQKSELDDIWVIED